MLEKKYIVLVIIIIVILVGIMYVFIPKEIHEHADFAVFINRKQINFSKQEYMSDLNYLSKRTHLHEMEGRVAHKHAPEVTWKEFFSTIGIELSKTCFEINNEKYCNNETHNLRVFVNRKEIFDIESQEIRDLDGLLITFDNDPNIEYQLSQLSDIACVFSNKCPERGQAVGENCVAGADAGCS